MLDAEEASSRRNSSKRKRNEVTRLTPQYREPFRLREHQVKPVETTGVYEDLRAEIRPLDPRHVLHFGCRRLVIPLDHPLLLVHRRVIIVRHLVALRPRWHGADPLLVR